MMTLCEASIQLECPLFSSGCTIESAIPAVFDFYFVRQLVEWTCQFTVGVVFLSWTLWRIPVFTLAAAAHGLWVEVTLPSFPLVFIYCVVVQVAQSLWNSVADSLLDRMREKLLRDCLTKASDRQPQPGECFSSQWHLLYCASLTSGKSFFKSVLQGWTSFSLPKSAAVSGVTCRHVCRTPWFVIWPCWKTTGLASWFLLSSSAFLPP